MGELVEENKHFVSYHKKRKVCLLLENRRESISKHESNFIRTKLVVISLLESYSRLRYTLHYLSKPQTN